MVLHPTSTGPLILRLLAAVLILGWPQTGSAAGTWSVISLPQKSGDLLSPTAIALDAAGNLYVADQRDDWIQRRDAQGKWSEVDDGQVTVPSALAADTAGNLYVADSSPVDAHGQIQRRDAQRNWSLIATEGTRLGQVVYPTALAVDAADTLYVADRHTYAEFGSGGLIQKRDAQGKWSVIATVGAELGQVAYPTALTLDAAGSLYVADLAQGIQKRDAHGSWSLIAASESLPPPYQFTGGIAVDNVGTLYAAVSVSVTATSQVLRRDIQGDWSVIATFGVDIGQVDLAYGGGLAVDSAGNLYVADTGNNRVQVYAPGP